MLSTYIEAEYESGYVHRETEEDRSPWVRDKNIFSDILEKRPEAVHGKLVRFSLVKGDERFDVDWTVLPENARPVRFKHMQGEFVDGGLINSHITSVDFGFQYTTEDGQNIQDVQRFV